MYKDFSREQWLELLKFPKDYLVSHVVIAGTPHKEKHLAYLNKILTNFNVPFSIAQFTDRPFIRGYEVKINNKIIWFDTSYGSAYLSVVVHIGSILGSRSNILIGACGGLNTKTKALDVIIPNFSYGNESTTRMYALENSTNRHYSSTLLAQQLTAIFSSSHNVYNETLITCQAHLGESHADIKKWGDEGYFGVEMESASMFAVSNYFKVPCIAVVHVNDNLTEADYIGSEKNLSYNDRREILLNNKYQLVFDYLLNHASIRQI